MHPDWACCGHTSPLSLQLLGIHKWLSSMKCPSLPWLPYLVQPELYPLLRPVGLDLGWTLEFPRRWKYTDLSFIQCSVFEVLLHSSMYRYFILFLAWITFHHLKRQHFIYPFIHWWTCGLFPTFVYWIYCMILFIWNTQNSKSIETQSGLIFAYGGNEE